MEIKEETMLAAWKTSIKHILEKGETFIDDEGRECHEVSNMKVIVEKPTSTVEGVRAMRRNRKWRYPSEEELSNIMLNKEAASIYDYLYGQRIFSYNGVVDQVNDFVVPLLQAKPNTRRAIISLLNPERDLKPEANNIVGISLIHFRVIDGRLNVTAVIRTSGFFTGWPANIFQIAKLQEYVAHALSLPSGKLTTISLSAHIHTENFEDMELVLGKKVMEGA